MGIDPQTQLQRLEQQLAAFEKLHVEELHDFEEKLATYVRLQADELRMLRQQLAELRQSLSLTAARGSSQAQPAGVAHPHSPIDQEAKR